MAGKGILLDENNDLLIIGKQMVIGDSQMQEVAAILEMNQGALKFSPLLGADLVQLIKSKASKVDIQRRVQIHLEKDGKDYNAIKNKIKTIT